MVIYNRWLVPSGFDAMTAWPFIFMVPEHKDDVGLHVHEMVHYKEMAWITPIWWLRYALSTKFRVAAEVRAYKAQIAAGGLTVGQAAGWLVKYDKSMTVEKAIQLLS